MDKIEFNNFTYNFLYFLNNEKVDYYNDVINVITSNDIIQTLTLKNKRYRLEDNKYAILNEYDVNIKDIEDERINNTNPYIIFDNITNNDEDIYYKVIQIKNQNNTISSIKRIYGYIDYFINSILKYYYYKNNNENINGYINIRKQTNEGIKIIYSNEINIFYNYISFKDIFYNNNDNNDIKTIIDNYYNIKKDIYKYENKEDLIIPYFNFNYEKYIKYSNNKSIDLNELNDIIDLFDDNIDLCIFFKNPIIKDNNIEINYNECYDKILNDNELKKYFYFSNISFNLNKDNDDDNIDINKKEENEEYKKENDEDKEILKRNIEEAKLFKEFLHTNISYRYIIEKQINEMLNHPLIRMSLTYYYIKKDQIIQEYKYHKENNFKTLIEDNKEKIIDILKNN